MSLMVSISGIRGIVGKTLTPETVVKYVSAFAEYCGKGPIAVGRDGRISGRSITHVVSSTLVQMGCDVTTLGVVPTPTVALAVEKLGLAGGISVTASHNPIEWNGLKFFAPTGLFLDADQNREFWKIADRAERHYEPWNSWGAAVPREDFRDIHIEDILALSYLDIRALKRRAFTVALDCVNASGGLIVPDLLRQLGCDVKGIHCDASGVFAHTPEPIPENLGDLSDHVRSSGADIGIAVDPDSDRLVLLDESGRPIGEEYSIAGVTDFVLRKEQEAKRGGHTVVVNLSTTRAVEDIARSRGATCIRTPVGEINVAKKMKEVGAVVGGEGSGGIILPAVHTGRDALVGIALVLQSLLEHGGPVSAWKSSLPSYEITKGKMTVGNAPPADILRSIADAYSERGRVNLDDGVKIDFEDSWVHLRASNTEPIIRIIAEGKTSAISQKLVDTFTNELRTLS